MKKKAHKDFIKWINEKVNLYAPVLGVSDQIINVEHNEKTTFISITCTYPYLEPTIHFSDRAFNEWSSGKMRQDRILHELCHILTDPLYCKAISRYASKDEIEDEREHLTDRLCVIIRNLINPL